MVTCCSSEKEGQLRMLLSIFQSGLPKLLRELPSMSLANELRPIYAPMASALPQEYLFDELQISLKEDFGLLMNQHGNTALQLNRKTLAQAAKACSIDITTVMSISQASKERTTFSSWKQLGLRYLVKHSHAVAFFVDAKLMEKMDNDGKLAHKTLQQKLDQCLRIAEKLRLALNEE